MLKFCSSSKACGSFYRPNLHPSMWWLDHSGCHKSEAHHDSPPSARIFISQKLIFFTERRLAVAKQRIISSVRCVLASHTLRLSTAATFRHKKAARSAAVKTELRSTFSFALLCEPKKLSTEQMQDLPKTFIAFETTSFSSECSERSCNKGNISVRGSPWKASNPVQKQ